MAVGFYAGTFDPVTNGHMDVLVRALDLFDSLIVGIGVHPGKIPMFSFEERASLIRQSLADHGVTADVEIVSFDNLTIDAAVAHGANVLVRGLRDGTDLNYEMQIAGMNAAMAPTIQTIFLPASAATRPITATLVRQIAKMGGDVSAFVPPPVLKALAAKSAKP